MDRGLYIASGRLAQQIRVDEIASDVGNAATLGYKRDRTAQREFGELLLTNRANGATVGARSTAVQVDGVETDFSPKPSRDTGEPLDFAITGEGFFGIRTGRGVRYTRNGQFTVSPQGLLVTAQGDPVLGRGGRTVRVGDDGRVDPRSLEVVRLDNARTEGDSLISGTPAGGAGAGQVRAGALEASGSDAARSMVDMIASLRAFDAGQRVLRTIDDTLARSATQVGSLPDAPVRAPLFPVTGAAHAA